MQQNIYISWNGVINKNEISIFRIIEDNENYLKEEYSKFINKFIDKKFIKSLDYSKSNICLMSRFYEKNLYSTPNIIKLFKIFLIRKLIKKKNIIISNIDHHEAESLKKILKNNKRIFFINIQKKLCDNLKVNFIILYYFRGLVTFIKFFILNLKFRFNNLSKIKNFKIIIFSYFINFEKNFELANWGNFRTLFSDKIAWMHQFYFNSTSIKKYKKLNNFFFRNYILNNNNNNNFQCFLEGCYSFSDLLKIFFIFTKFNFKNSLYYFKLKKTLKNNEINRYLFEYIKKDFLHSFFGSGLIRSLIYIFHFKNIFKFLNYKAVIFYSKEGFGWENALICESGARKKIGIIHSPVRSWDLKFYIKNKFKKKLPDFTIISSNNCFRIMIKNGYNFNNLKMLENLKFSKKLQTNNTKCINKNKKILILGSFFDSLTLDLLENLQRLQFKCNFDIKLHPASEINQNKFDSKRFSFINDNLNELLTKDKYDLCIIDSDSSVALDLLIYKKSFMIYISPKFINTSFIKMNNYLFFSDVSKIKEILEKDFSKFRINYQNYIENNSNLTKWKYFLNSFK
jgi:surface carbohydrate biosynthesis protein (TIGR04326 family)